MGTQLDLSAAPLPPTRHQIAGIEQIVQHKAFFLMDEMGMGKSMQVISASSVLFTQHIIDRVVIVAPASVRSVWSDPEHGQIVTHGWPTISNLITIYHRRKPWFVHGADHDRYLEWIVTNYEYIRGGGLKLETLIRRCDERTLLVLDESTAIKSTTAAQTKACQRLRKRCGRVVLLTGTPIAHSPLDLLSQANMLHPAILSDRPGESMNLYQFRNKYCRMGGYQGRHILEFPKAGLQDLQKRLKPVALRREKKDCLDLPPKLAPVTLTATLSADSWKLYKDMRQHALIELAGQVSVAPQAVTKLLRLSQLTSGFVGGLRGPVALQHTGTEKIDVLVQWVETQLAANPTFKVVIWSVFREDVIRVSEALERLSLEVGRLWGQSPAQERDHALRLLHPSTVNVAAPCAVVGTPSAGSLGITLAGASTVCYMNSPYSLSQRLQSEDRTHRPGQTAEAVSYYEIAAEGPSGQRTIDHIVIKALRQRQELAEWTAAAWLDHLKQQKTSGPSF